MIAGKQRVTHMLKLRNGPVKSAELCFDFLLVDFAHSVTGAALESSSTASSRHVIINDAKIHMLKY